MARPKALELTDRELQVMQVFWNSTEATVEDAHQFLQQSGETITYVTVANLVRGLVDKGFLKQTGTTRPYAYKNIRAFEEVSGRLIGDLLQRVFRGSRENMLVHLFSNGRLSQAEKMLMQRLLEEAESGESE